MENFNKSEENPRDDIIDVDALPDEMQEADVIINVDLPAQNVQPGNFASRIRSLFAMALHPRLGDRSLLRVFGEVLLIVILTNVIFDMPE